jgi:hypothetical protein
MAMFSEMIAVLHNNRMPEPDVLQKRYDFAMTKKLGIVKLPSAFWMRDPKINPRSDHLFWAALLLKDRQRVDMALSVIAVELAEPTSMKGDECRQRVDCKARELIAELLEQFSDTGVRQQFEQELRGLVPEWLALTGEKP